MPEIKSICVYCGSQPGNNSTYLAAANTLGTAMAASGIRLVYGGGDTGIMGEVAKASKKGSGAIIGIIPDFLINRERGNGGTELGDVIVTKDMHERKHKMFEASDAFVALPGGIGTLEELVEIMTWAQLGRHNKPIVLANIDGFWDPLLELVSHMSEAGFIHSSSLLNLIVVEDSAEILPAILTA